MVPSAPFFLPPPLHEKGWNVLFRPGRWARSGKRKTGCPPVMGQKTQKTPKREGGARPASEKKKRSGQQLYVVAPLTASDANLRANFFIFWRGRSQKGGEKRDIIWPKDGEGSLQVANAAVSYPTVMEGVAKGKNSKGRKKWSCSLLPPGGAHRPSPLNSQ